jgi:hypothetical protein
VGRTPAYPSVDNQENHTFTKKSTPSLRPGMSVVIRLKTF